uniref:C2H2-type domain-containing protein n=1 Tax=Arcella intermedia TaxID=1963864 RepID=A0A6B2L286_9EUKA
MHSVVKQLPQEKIAVLLRQLQLLFTRRELLGFPPATGKPEPEPPVSPVSPMVPAIVSVSPIDVNLPKQATKIIDNFPPSRMVNYGKKPMSSPKIEPARPDNFISSPSMVHQGVPVPKLDPYFPRGPMVGNVPVPSFVPTPQQPIQFSFEHLSQLSQLLEQSVIQPPKPIIQQMSWTDPVFKSRNPQAVYSLYESFQFQCSQCGLRIKDQKSRDLHLDIHFRQHRRDKMKTKKAMSRPWYLTRDLWVLADNSVQEANMPTPFENPEPEQQQVDEKNEDLNVRVAVESDQVLCPACQDTLDISYDSESDQWICKGGVKGPDNEVYHQKCLELDQTQEPEQDPDNEEDQEEATGNLDLEDGGQAQQEGENAAEEGKEELDYLEGQEGEDNGAEDSNPLEMAQGMRFEEADGVVGMTGNGNQGWSRDPRQLAMQNRTLPMPATQGTMPLQNFGNFYGGDLNLNLEYQYAPQGTKRFHEDNESEAFVKRQRTSL